MADVKQAYVASAAFTITLASLATSSSRTAGRNATAIDNTTNKYLDYLVAGKVTTGTTPTTAKQIDVWVYGSFEDSPTYPDSVTGTDAAFTATTADILAGSMQLAASISTDATSNRTYWFSPFTVARLFGGQMPKFFSIFVTHDTAVNLNSTGSNQAFWQTGLYYTVV